MPVKFQVSYDCGKVKWKNDDQRVATLDDVGKSIHQQLALMVEWAKSLSEISKLTVEDQVREFFTFSPKTI